MTSELTMNPIDAVKKAVVDYINTHDYFAGIECIWDEKGDVDTQIQAKINAIGLGILVEAVKGSSKFKNVGSQAMDIEVTITIEENVVINRDSQNTSASGKKATDVLCMLYAIFDPIQAALSGTKMPMTLNDFDLIRNTGGSIIYQITGTAQAGWKIKQ